MKNFYLFLAVTAVVVTCKPQRSNNDIIWYPVDDEDGVFVSIYGEKYRTTPQVKYRSHRRARFSGFDPIEETDFSIFAAQDRRKTKSIPSVPVSLQQQYPKNPFFNPGLMSQKFQKEKNDNLKDIINEVFGVNKLPPGDGFTGGENVNLNQWNNNKNQNQWSSTNQWKPEGSTTPNQWGSGSNSGLIQKPTDSEWFITEKPTKPNNQNRPNNNRPNRPNNNRPNRPNNRPNKPNKPNRKTTTTTTTESDKLVFPDETPVTPPSRRTTTASGNSPVDPPTLSPCELTCPVTPEFNPVCGTDSVTYTNSGRLKCAQLCGKDVELSHHGNCGRTKFATPLLSDTFREKRKGRFQTRDWD